MSSDILYGLTQAFLLPRYDNPRPIPKFHSDLWELFCGPEKLVAAAAPRGHGKSTAVTHTFVLFKALSGQSDFILIISDTETQAVQFLGDIKAELHDNDGLKETFGFDKFIKETESDVIVRFKNGNKFRIIAKGSEQKVRGIKWNNRRPNLVVIDDAENDESVMNPDRRRKFRDWFQNALLPCGGDTCIFRMVGTVLHLDSMLNSILLSETWKTIKWQAHNKDFTEILWPEKFNKERLLDIRAGYEESGNLQGYSQEYLNNPVAEGDLYFRKQDFLEMDDPDHEKPMVYVSAADFAISEKERADYTVIMTAGIDEDGFIYILDVRRGRIGSLDIIDELISIGRRYDPEVFTFETEKIDKAIGPFLDQEMRKTGVYLNIFKVTPSNSKTTRGKSIREKMRAGAVKFDKKTDWYADMEMELMTITNSGPKGKHDDFFDAFAYIGLSINKYNIAPTQHEIEEEDWDDEYGDDFESGICVSTGY